MARTGHLVGLIFLELGAAIGLACGSSNPNENSQRQALSVSVTPATASAPANGRVQFTATGTYNTAPTVVNPLQATWVVLGPSNAPTTEVTINTNGLAQCSSAASGSYTVGAWVVQYSGNPPTPICNVISPFGNPCGDSVLGMAQLTCP